MFEIAIILSHTVPKVNRIQYDIRNSVCVLQILHSADFQNSCKLLHIINGWFFYTKI